MSLLFFIFWIRANLFCDFSDCRRQISKCFDIIRFVFLWMSVTKQHRIYMCVMYIVRLYAYIEQCTENLVIIMEQYISKDHQLNNVHCTVHLVILMEQYISKDHQLGTFDAKIEILYSTIYSMSKICSWPAQSFAIFTLVTTSPNRGTESCK